MAKCKECRYGRMGLTQPMEGYCIYGSRVASETESTTGSSAMMVQGRMINLRDEACKDFEKKPSHKDFIKESN
ncbi:MAG: hypothetical protein WA113_01040 [Desulfitobacteriaceae bacterium]